MRFRLLFVLPTMLLLGLAVWPLAVGGETLYFRDVLSSHWPLKAAQAQLLAEGQPLPLVDPFRAGQPLLGNPNALVLYPTSLLLLVADPLWVLDAHIWLHLLLAPWAGYWLGRAWGLGRPAAWAVGAAYSVGGFLLSTANLYNMVAGAALTPAFVASCLDAARHEASRHEAGTRGSARSRWALAGLLWALLLLAGDPTLAAVAAALGASAVVVRSGSARRLLRPLVGLALAGVGGLLVAAPQIVETLRILPRSRRGYWRFDSDTVLVQSWHPATLLEQVTPLVFGGPLAGAWGTTLHGGHEPLILSLHLGWAVLALVVVSVGYGGRAAAWAWTWTALGLFVALGAHNPLLPPLLGLPGASLLRYPMRLWSLPALMLSLLAGIGLERLLATDPPARLLRRYRLVLGLGLGLVATALVGLLLPGAPSARMPARWVALWRPSSSPDDLLDSALLAAEAYRWSVTWLLLAALLTLLLGVSLLWRRAPRRAAAATLALHVGSQLLLLAPLLDTDDADAYRAPRGLLASLPTGPLIAHDDSMGVFGSRRRPTFDPADRSLAPVTRTRLERAPHSLGIAHGRRYAFAPTPEGLDSFFTSAVLDALKVLDDDDARLQMLRASGVDRLVTPRPLDVSPGALELLDVIEPDDPAGARHGASPSWLYRLEGSAPAYFLAERIHWAPTMNDGSVQLAAPAFDARREVVLPARNGDSDGDSGGAATGGTVRVLTDAPERIELEVSSPGGAVLVASERAWLPLWRARIDIDTDARTEVDTVDNTEAEVLIANMHRLGVAVPAGTHRVTLWVDRRPTRAAIGVSLLALGILGTLWLRGAGPRRRSRETSPRETNPRETNP